MRRERIDVPGMIRALEDYLAAARPAPPPEPPRRKTETESKLEKLLEDLSKPLPPAPEPAKLETDSSHDETVDRPLEDVEQLSAGSFQKSVDSPSESKLRPVLRLLLAMTILCALAPLLMWRHPTQVVVRKPASIASARPPAPAPVAPARPLPGDPQARALALVLSYRPSGGPVTTGEIFRSIVGDPIPAENLEFRAQGPDRFLIRFVPYRGALGENSSYDFTVDARASWVRPRPDTVERLRADAIGRLAGRSDLQAFRQFLDLGR